MFTKAIVRKPGKSVINGITTANLGKVNYEKLCMQHSAYVDALKRCGLEVMMLEPNENYPDSVFIEDVALLSSRCAIITLPGAKSRKGEQQGLEQVLQSFYKHIEKIIPDGTVEAGDVMMAGDHFFIGLSERTNAVGADQLISILVSFGYSASTVQLGDILHLKTGVSYLENNTMVAVGSIMTNPAFLGYTKIRVEDDESYAANCLWINGNVLLPAGFPKIRKAIEDAGYPVTALDMTEFQKLDGGLSCLSLRF